MIDRLFAALVWLFCGPSVRSLHTYTDDVPRVFCANHSSNLDALLIWTSLPAHIRRRTRPVAARDYWGATALRRYISTRLLRAVLIERRKPTRDDNPLKQMQAVLDSGDSLIIFPEGTRDASLAGNEIGPFKSGVYHLCKGRPGTELVPVFINNLNRVLPKGEFLPVPLLCSVTYGRPQTLQEGETKVAFLERLHAEMVALRPVRPGVAPIPAAAPAIADSDSSQPTPTPN